jgi:putative Mg2+ transporter-C (MgtC) family protein
MLAPNSIHFTQLEQLHLSPSTVARLATACLLGGAIGLEREWKHKPSGLRTNMLLCLGCALFTILSAALAGDSQDKSRVASNIVQGIGFLGAGLILHTRNRVLGLTSAATVFVVASIGMACGAGLYVEAVLATIIVVVTVQMIGVVERRSGWKHYAMVYELRWLAPLAADAATFEKLFGILDREGLGLTILDRDSLPGIERLTFSAMASRAIHARILAELRSAGIANTVQAFPDGEQD